LFQKLTHSIINCFRNRWKWILWCHWRFGDAETFSQNLAVKNKIQSFFYISTPTYHL